MFVSGSFSEMNTDRRVFDLFKQFTHALVASDLPPDDCLAALELAWLVVARRIRAEAIAFPEGFSDAKTRQLGRLEKVAELVRADSPDLELEVLYHEENYEAALDLLDKRFSERKGTGDAPTE